MPLSRYLPLVLACLAVSAVRAQEPRTITSLKELRQLSRAEAAQSIPFDVRGTITYFEPTRNLVFIQSEDGAAYVQSRMSWAPDSGRRGAVELVPGDYVRLRGVSSPGGFAPSLAMLPGETISVEFLWRRPIPNPLRLHPRVFLDPSLDSYWVDAVGVVRSVSLNNRRLSLVLADGSREYVVYFAGNYSESDVPENLVGSRIRIAAIYGSVINRDRELIGVQFFSPGLDRVTILEEGAEAVFAKPPLDYSDLFRYRADSAERVHVEGVVTAAFPPNDVYITVDGQALRVQTDASPLPPPGARVQIAAYPEINGQSVELHTATLRTTGQPMEIEPLFIADANELQELSTGQLIRIEGQLLDTLGDANQSLLLLDNGFTRFTATLRRDRTSEVLAPPLGGWLQLTGIYYEPGEPARENSRAAPGFSLRLRSIDDVLVLRAPPFWTAGKILGAVTLLTIGLVASALWSFLLQHKVRHQAGVIALQREAGQIQAERDRIARELHDTLEQDLAAVSIQLGIAEDTQTVAPETALTSVRNARAMLRRTQSQSRHTIQDLRDDLLARKTFADALELVVQRLQLEHAVPLNLQLAPNLPKLSPEQQHHLLMIAREAISNAIHHAASTGIRIECQTSPVHGLLMKIQDDGHGFDVSVPHPGHFGLVGMHERARILGAEFQLESTPGQGTQITLHLPIPTPPRPT